MDEFTVIGKILKPQALKGEVRVGPITRDATQFLTYKYLYVGPELEKYDIDYCRIQDGFVIVKFSKIVDANMAESLRNFMLYIDRSQLATLEDGEYFIKDLLDCEVLDELGFSYGKIIAVDEFSSVNTITTKKEENEFLFPFLDQVVVDVDIEVKKVFVKKEKLMEVLVDEN